MSKYTITPQMMTSYSLTRDQITILKNDYGFKMENGSLSLDDNQIDGALEKVVKECIESSQNVTAVTSINYETGLLGVLRKLGAEKIEQYRESLYKMENDINDVIIDNKVVLLIKLYFLDPKNQYEYAYYLISIGFFKPIDQKFMGVLNITDSDVIKNGFCNIISGYDNNLRDYILRFKFYSIKASKALPREYKNIFTFLECLRIITQKKRRKQLIDILSDSYDDRNGQISPKKAEKLSNLQQELSICAEQTPTQSFSFELNRIPCDLIGVLLDIYTGKSDKVNLDIDVSLTKNIYDALKNNQYLSAFKLAQQPRYKNRNPLIYILLARIVLENTTALLTREIHNNSITVTNVEQIKKLIRYFLVSLNRIEYERKIIAILDDVVSGKIDSNVILTLISKLYYNGDYSFKGLTAPTGYQLCQYADMAQKDSEYETATLYYARGLELIGEEEDNYAGWEKSYEESFSSFKEYHDKRM